MQMMNQCGKVNGVGGGGKILFSHGTHHSKGVCILLDPSINNNVEYFFSNNTGSTVLITTLLNGMKTSLCNIYTPNNQSEQLEFTQEMPYYIIHFKFSKSGNPMGFLNYESSVFLMKGNI